MITELSPSALEDLLDRPEVAVELGCGPAKRDANAIGVDVLDHPGVDVRADALAFLAKLPDGCVDRIYSEHFMEHIDDPLALMREAARALRPGGTFVAVIPHFSNAYFYSDPTHRSLWGLYSFCYWTRNDPFRRKVPHYTTPIPMDVTEVTYHFKSTRPFYVRHAIRRALTFWVNFSTWSKEFYEENMSNLVSAYELRYTLTRLPTTKDGAGE